MLTKTQQLSSYTVTYLYTDTHIWIYISVIPIPVYHLASKCHSSNEFSIWGPIVKSISPRDKVGTGLLESQSSSQHPRGKLAEMGPRSAIYKNTWFDAICSHGLMHGRGLKDQLSEQRTCSISVDPATTKRLETFWKRDTPPLAFSACCPWKEGRRLEPLAKQVSFTGEPKPVDPNEGLGFVTESCSQSLLTPHKGYHTAAETWAEGTWQKMSLLHLKWRCCLSLTCLPRADWAIRKSPVLPTSTQKPSTIKQKLQQCSGHVESRARRIQGDWLSPQQPAWLTHTFK